MERKLKAAHAVWLSMDNRAQLVCLTDFSLDHGWDCGSCHWQAVLSACYVQNHQLTQAIKGQLIKDRNSTDVKKPLVVKLNKPTTKKHKDNKPCVHLSQILVHLIQGYNILLRHH